jgi:hypothetical protein
VLRPRRSVGVRHSLGGRVRRRRRRNRPSRVDQLVVRLRVDRLLAPRSQVRRVGCVVVRTAARVAAVVAAGLVEVALDLPVVAVIVLTRE